MKRKLLVARPFLYYQNINENSLPSQQDRVLSMCASHIIRNLVKMADVAGETYPTKEKALRTRLPVPDKRNSQSTSLSLKHLRANKVIL